jgi:spore coat polysaccharide biosynthesis predicted glycosyltransferase SpsG
LPKSRYQIFDWVKDPERMRPVLSETDSVIIDSYLAPGSLYEDISGYLYSKAGSLLMIDDFKRVDYPGGIVANPSVYGHSLRYPKNERIKYLLGESYIILRKDFWEIPGKTINMKIRNVLVTFGGVDYLGLANKVSDFIREEFGFSSYVVDPRRSRLGAKKMLDLMLKADVCISGGGQTIHELARVGVPTIGICFAENQRLNLDGWRKKRFIEYAGEHADIDLLNGVAGCMRKLVPYETRLERSKAGRSCIDGKGVLRIIDSVIGNN